jgi:hypothetical protein
MTNDECPTNAEGKPGDSPLSFVIGGAFGIRHSALPEVIGGAFGIRHLRTPGDSLIGHSDAHQSTID